MDLTQFFADSQRAALVLRAINNKLRRKMILFFSTANPVSVTQIYVHFRIEQAVASQHLAILRRAGLLKTMREGKKIFYWLHVENFEAISKSVEELRKFDTPRNKEKE